MNFTALKQLPADKAIAAEKHSFSMKVVCLTESVSRLGGGLFDAERRLQQTAVAANPGLMTTAIGMQDRHAAEDLKMWKPVGAQFVHTAGLGAGLGYSRNFRKRLDQVEPDLIYCIGLWKYFSRACLQWHQTSQRPYLVAPHGMLDEWAMRNHKLRKKIVWGLYQGQHLKKAACIRALNASEARSIRKLGLTNPICVIPNGVDMPSFPDPGFWIKDGHKKLLFLGRIHPKKGLDVLLQSWNRVHSPNSDWRLQIAGWGQTHHVSQLKALIKDLNLAKSVEFLGPIFGQEKSHAFQNADAFILPSFSEGMPMTVLEAWSYRLPVVMTPFCNIPAGEQHQACLMCEPNPDSVVAALCAIFEMHPQERQAMGMRGQKLVEKRFTWAKVAADLVEVYRWLVETGTAPNSVCFE